LKLSYGNRMQIIITLIYLKKLSIIEKKYGAKKNLIKKIFFVII